MSGSTYPIYDPATGTADGKGRTPFPGNIVPQARMEPIVQKIVNTLTPPPMFAGILSNNFYAAGPVPREGIDERLFRVGLHVRF